MNPVSEKINPVREDKMMKIIIATPLFPPELGEPAQYVFELAKRLKESHQIVVVTYANHVEPIDGVRIKKVSKNQHTLIRLYKYTRVLMRSAQKADVIYAQRGVASGLPAIIAGWLSKVPVVINYIEDEAWERLNHLHPSEHQGQFRKTRKIPGAVWGIWHIQHTVLRYADAVIAPSDFLRDELIRTHELKPKKVHTCYAPAQKKLHLPIEPKKQKHMMYVDTRLVTWKDVATAIRTVALLKETFSDIALVVAGEGPERQALEELIQEKGLEKHVTLLGHLSRAERHYHLQRAQVFFSPAMYEDKSQVLYDALSYGIPIAVSDVPGQREKLEHKKNALVLPPGNALACTDAFTELFGDMKLEQKLIQNGNELLKNTFSFEAHIKTLQTVCKEIIHHE
jgi:glycosyltransferase involved in cell wall biosynthesis